ncbi:hypothetical protein MTO96_011957 [Rhipicephalus appendiculatus]
MCASPELLLSKGVSEGERDGRGVREAAGACLERSGCRRFPSLWVQLPVGTLVFVPAKVSGSSPARFTERSLRFPALCPRKQTLCVDLNDPAARFQRVSSLSLCSEISMSPPQIRRGSLPRCGLHPPVPRR